MENQLKKMANFNKKRKRGRGWWINLDASDVPKAIDSFNNGLTTSGESCDMCEGVERLPDDYKPEKTGKGYKVFRLINGKLYPPMVANNGGDATPMNVWLKAQVGKQAPPTKTGRLQVQGGGKGTGHSKVSLAFRPGWHLGDIPYAKQFLKKDGTWPNDLVWAECDFAMDVDYQEEANKEGYTEKGKFQHSLAGLKRIPENGYYKYRTNPDPNTIPWVITGAMKVNRILDDEEVEQLLTKNGIKAPKINGGNRKVLESLGKGKDEIFNLIREINPNSKEENYRDMDVNQMLSVLYNMRKRKEKYSKDRFNQEDEFTGVSRDPEDGQLYHYSNGVRSEVATEEESEPEYFDRKERTMNIKEELNRLDWEHIDEGFNLRTLYGAKEWSSDDKKKIATMICNGNITKLHNFLNESLKEIEEEPLDLKSLGIKDEALHISQSDGKIWKTVRGAIKATQKDDVDFQADNVMDNLHRIADKKVNESSNTHWTSCSFDFNNDGKYDSTPLELNIDKALRRMNCDWTYDVMFENMDNQYKNGYEEYSKGHWTKCTFDFKNDGNYNEKILKKYINEALVDMGCDWTYYLEFEDVSDYYGINENKVNDILRKGVFTILDDRDENRIVGYTNGETWQNDTCTIAFFEKDAALDYAKSFNGLGYCIYFDKDHDRFYTTLDGEVDEVFKSGFIANTIDGKKKLYDLGSYNWMWYELKGELERYMKRKSLKESLDDRSYEYQDLIQDLADRVNDPDNEEDILYSIDDNLGSSDDLWTAIKEFADLSDVINSLLNSGVEIYDYFDPSTVANSLSNDGIDIYDNLYQDVYEYLHGKES